MWLLRFMKKEARSRRYRSDDRVRVFTGPTKGTGRGVVWTPRFQRGRVSDYDQTNRRYLVETESGEQIYVHPRNMVPDSFERGSPTEGSTNVPAEEQTGILTEDR